MCSLLCPQFLTMFYFCQFAPQKQTVTQEYPQQFQKSHFRVIIGKLDPIKLCSSSVSPYICYFALVNLDFQVPFCHLFIQFCDAFVQHLASFDNVKDFRSKTRLSFKLFCLFALSSLVMNLRALSI